MIPGRARVLNVLHAVEAAREVHPELALPLNWGRLERVLARERVQLMRAPIEGKAHVVGVPPYFVIVINSSTPARYQARHAAHEYAHIRLHFSQPGETERQLAPCRREDPREWEAELFATLLMLGPAATIEHPDAARLADRIVAHAVRTSRPPQIPLPITGPQTHPPVPIPPAPDDRKESPLHFVLRTRREMAGRRARTWGHGCSHDALRFDWSKEGRPLRFFDYTHGWLDVYDLHRDAAGRIETLKAGDRRAAVRVFVLSATDRRRYVFADAEKRSRSVKDLEQQLRAAILIPPPTKAAAAQPNALNREKKP